MSESNPSGPVVGTERVVRGGYWFSRPQDLFGQFGLQHHVGKSHPHLMGTGKFVGTTDSERLRFGGSLPLSPSRRLSSQSHGSRV